MSHALSIRPTPLRQFLSREPYVSIDPIIGDDLFTIAERALQVWEHYFDPVTITHQREAFAEQFYELVGEWRNDTQFQSSLLEITTHPTYQAIIDLGEAAVPYILCELELRPNFWFTALRAISGVDPVRPKDKGHIDKMSRAWLQWGRKQGLNW